MTDDPADRVRTALAASAKYGGLLPETLDRVAGWAAHRHRKPADAIAAARRKLHQVMGAFLDASQAARARKLLDAMPPDPEGMRKSCRSILALHASTAERLAGMESFYAGIFSRIPPPRSILDLGCGLNPFALPFMNLPAGCTYTGWDCDPRVASLGSAFVIGRFPAAAVKARDLLVSPPPAADLALLLKLLPTLDQQADGAGEAFLRTLPAPRAVASFPIRSLGGRSKGMVETYQQRWEPVFTATGWTFERLDLETELAYLLIRESRIRAASPGGVV